jgi:hypothetical protein
MSSYTILASVTKALRTVLWEACATDPAIRAIVGSEDAIVFTNPTETVRDSANRLSLWLYQVTENEFLKNQPPQHANGHRLQETPLALNLFYLITPFAGSGPSDQLLLGLTMQTLYDNAILLLQRPTEGGFVELRLVLSRLSLEELTRIWEALREPYRLSICYEVRVTQIDSLRRSSAARVLQVEGQYDDEPGKARIRVPAGVGHSEE